MRREGQCRQPGCKLTAWKHRLCYTHWKLSLGFIFDSDRKVFIRPKQR
jgi:hypothetical protein